MLIVIIDILDPTALGGLLVPQITSDLPFPLFRKHKSFSYPMNCQFKFVDFIDMIKRKVNIASLCDEMDIHMLAYYK